MINQDKHLEEQELQGLFQAAEWMQHLMNGVISRAETEALDHWIKQSERHKTWFASLVGENATTDHLRTYKEVSAGTSVAFVDICEKTGVNKAMQKQRSRRRQLLAVAVLLPLLAGSGWLLSKVSHRPKPEKTTAVADFKPGGNRALLRLSDGRSLILDSASIGLLATQGNAKVRKLKDGQVSYSLQNWAEKGDVSYNTISTPVGGTFSVVLSDGTQVWLNSGSSLRYPVSFGKNPREVFLKGEGYFEVSPAAGSSFTVVVNDSVRVQVLGTAFNIQSYSDEPAIRTTLIQGSVKMIKGQETSLLMPGEQAVLEASSKIRINKSADMEEAVAWKNGLFRFGHADLRTILRQVSRWYGVSVVYETEPPTTYLRGEAPRNVNLSKLLEGLSTMNIGVRCALRGNVLVVAK